MECAREIMEKSQGGTLSKESFIQISDDLELLLIEVCVWEGKKYEFVCW